MDGQISDTGLFFFRGKPDAPFAAQELRWSTTSMAISVTVSSQERGPTPKAKDQDQGG